MGMTLLGPTRTGEEDESFAVYGFTGGLNIKSMPQELDDGDLTVAYNVYLRTDGGIEQRKGMNGRGLMPTPSAPSLQAGLSGAGTLLNGTYNVEITWVNALGQSLASAANSVAVGSGASLGISSPASLINALSYAYYVSPAGGAASTCTEQGLAAIGTSVALSAVTVSAISAPTSSALIGPIGVGVGKNIIRFSQTIVNGVPVSLTNPTRFLLAQIGDSLWDYDGSSQIGATGALGTNSLPWSAIQAYDADHVLAVPPAPAVSSGASGAGTSLFGTYNVLITWINASGESLPSSASSVVVGSGASLGISSPAAYGNALSYAVYLSTAGGATSTATKQQTLAIGTGVSLASLSSATSLPTVNNAIAPSDVLVMCTGVGGPYIFDGSIIYTPAAYSAVSAARWVSAINGIGWFGGIPSQSNLAVATLVGNHIETPQTFFSMTAPVTGLAPLGAGALGGMTVGHYKGLSVLYGTGSSNFFENDFIHTDYPDGGRTMISVNGLIFFLGSTAIWMFDGTNITRISDKVEPWILNDPLHPDFPMNGNRTLSFCWFYNNRLHFAYDSGNLGYCTAYLIFDLIVQGWTLFYGPKLSGACLLDAPGDADPHACVVMDATNGQAYNWDQYNGLGTNGHGVTDNGAAIQAIFQTKYFKIEEPGCAKKIVRWYPELFVESFTGQFTLTTDYGLTSYSQAMALAANEMTWDQSNWDQANWASAAPVFFQPKLEVGELTPLTDTTGEFEAISFGIQNNASDPPFQFAGASGDIIFEPRS